MPEKLCGRYRIGEKRIVAGLDRAGRRDGYSENADIADTIAVNSVHAAFKDLEEAYMPIVAIFLALVAHVRRIVYYFRPGRMILLVSASMYGAHIAVETVKSSYLSPFVVEAIELMGQVFARLVWLCCMLSVFEVPRDTMPGVAIYITTVIVLSISRDHLRLRFAPMVVVYAVVFAAVEGAEAYMLPSRTRVPSEPSILAELETLWINWSTWPRWKKRVAVKSHILLPFHIFANPDPYYYAAIMILSVLSPIAKAS